MAGLLDGQLASAIYAGFKNKLLKGALRRASPIGGVNDLGDPVAVNVQTWAMQGFTDQYSAYYRAQAGIPDTDLKVCIFGKGLPSGIRPRKDDQVSFTQAGITTWYQLRAIGVDPANALYECQAFQITAPLNLSG